MFLSVLIFQQINAVNYVLGIVASFDKPPICFFFFFNKIYNGSWGVEALSVLKASKEMVNVDERLGKMVFQIRTKSSGETLLRPASFVQVKMIYQFECVSFSFACSFGKGIFLCSKSRKYFISLC